MSSTKEAVWTGMTVTHGFRIEVFHDHEQGLFTAYIHASSPALVPQIRPGEKAPTMQFDEPIKMQPMDDLDRVKAETKLVITQRYGKILQFR